MVWIEAKEVVIILLSSCGCISACLRSSLLSSLLFCRPWLLQLVGAPPVLACGCTRACMLDARHVHPKTGQMAVSLRLTAAEHAYRQVLAEILHGQRCEHACSPAGLKRVLWSAVLSRSGLRADCSCLTISSLRPA